MHKHIFDSKRSEVIISSLYFHDLSLRNMEQFQELIIYDSYFRV